MKKLSTIIGGIAAVGGILSLLVFKNNLWFFGFLFIILATQAIISFFEY